ncbi:MAG TPA: hypothetical protein VFT47_16115 [Vicinamibacterales bacterium]|nr:hypothetical protein [Vicinamibacterales bacterium]
MTSPPRPPPKVLFVHDGIPYEAHMKHLADSGLEVTEAHATAALVRAIAIQPNIIVLDFDCDGEITAQLKGDAQTQHIPIIALASLAKPKDDGAATVNHR